MTHLVGPRLVLRSMTVDDVDALVTIRQEPEVARRWGSADLRNEVIDALDDDDLEALVIELDETTIGSIQWAEEEDPDYRHASIDIYLDPSAHGNGFGTEAVRLVVRHLIDHHGHHRLTIDPAADNAAAIACYSKVGFKPVGVLRRSERIDDGEFHDGLLMDLLAEEFVDPGSV